MWRYARCTFKLIQFNVARLSTCHNVKRSDSQAFVKKKSLQLTISCTWNNDLWMDFIVDGLFNCHNMELSNYRAVILWNCQTIELSHCHTFILWNCQSIELSHCHTFILWKCQTIELSHCHTFILCCQTIERSE